MISSKRIHSTVNIQSLHSTSEVMPGFEHKLVVKGSALSDGLQFIAFAGQAIAQDEFSKCFVQKPRNNAVSYLLKGLRAPLSIIGMIYRYFVLFPIRLSILLGSSLAFFSALPLVLYLKNDKWKVTAVNAFLFRFYCRAFLRSWGTRIKVHGKKPLLSEPHIFVSNHTSFIDFIVLSADSFPHATVAQKHGGLIGYFQKHVLNLNGSLIFDRATKEDRSIVSKRMREHVKDVSNTPLLLFPEGTCVNNEYTVLFQKGAFDLGVKVAPVAIKYDKNTADAYWHTKTQTFTTHLLYLMTRKCLLVDIWYLNPRSIRPNQTAAEFASEVKQEISQIAGLKNLVWDGYWKNFVPSQEKQEILKENPRQRYGKMLLKRTISNLGAKSFRRNSLMGDASFTEENDITFASLLDQPDYIDKQNQDSNISIRNLVLMSIENQERDSNLISIVKNKRDDIVEEWKRYTGSKTNNPLDTRIENMTWRLWFKLRLEKEQGLDVNEEETSILDYLAHIFPFSDRTFNPDDVFDKNQISLADLNQGGDGLYYSQTWDFDGHESDSYDD